MKIIISIIVGYLLGSIPVSYIIGKLQKGIDLRDYGSGNLGATNVLRNLGLASFILCAVLDVLKSYIAFKLAAHYIGDGYAVIAGFAAVLGHCYSPFLNFSGGKGVASSGGLILALDPKILLIVGIILFLVLFLGRRMSLASISAAASLPFIYLYFYPFDNLFFGVILLAGFVIFKHRDNIDRLIKGQEPRLF